MDVSQDIQVLLNGLGIHWRSSPVCVGAIYTSILFDNLCNVYFTGDFTVRIWEIDSSDNFLLPMEMSSTPLKTQIPKIKHPQLVHSDSTSSMMTPIRTSRMEVFTCIAFSTNSHTLCAGTNQGNVYAWKRTARRPAAISDGYDHGWQLSNKSNVRGAIKHCCWGICENSKPCVLVNCVSNVYILKV